VAAKELTCRHSLIFSSNYFCTFYHFINIYFTQHYREDWSEDLPEYAKKLGFGDGPDSVLAMLKTFPEHISLQEEFGQIKLKPIPSEQTKHNLALIDKSNEEKAKRKRQRNPANYLYHSDSD
jgi:hypothetical protein